MNASHIISIAFPVIVGYVAGWIGCISWNRRRNATPRHSVGNHD